MEELKQIIAKNIAKLRTAGHLTQAELAEKLDYSDKAISKWERAESIPDIGVLKRIADLFGVTVDWLLSEHGERVASTMNTKRKNHRMVTLLAVSGVWFAAAAIFAGLWLGGAGAQWLTFVAAVPASCLLLLIFNCVWGNRKNNLYIISALVWTAIAFTYLLLLGGYWILFLVGMPVQAAVIIAHHIEKR